METAFSVLVGIGLAAACGFRMFVPFLVMSLAAMAGHLTLESGFEWIGTVPALIALAVATLLEVLAFYVPWIDNVLDAIATPATFVAGTIAAASVAVDLPPFVKWSFALIAGGGAAGLIQGGSVATRATSTVATGGFGNFIVSTVELVGAALTSVLAIFVPVVAILAVVVLGFISWRLARRRRRRARVSEI